jgi:tetratricopeptide (TPR) repeat protein
MPISSRARPSFKRQPQHPGVAHYLIHLYDYPPIADKGLDAASRYSKIAPAAPHAQHMPSHIFTRVGYWKESIAANQASVRAAKADKAGTDQLHGQDYMVYAYLQLAQDKNAHAVIDEMAQSANFSPDVQGGPYALAASPARYMVERGDWQGAAELEVKPSKFAHVVAITHFARALGAARVGKPDAAKAEIGKLAELREKLRQAKDAYWAEQVDVQWQVASAWLLYAQGKYDEALKAMSAAADAEDKTEKAPVTPGPLAPARELYGAMLLERGMPKEALAAFDATLKKEPHRLGATIGAAKAAEKAGDLAKARQHYAAAVALAENADPVRPEIAAARAFVAQVR